MMVRLHLRVDDIPFAVRQEWKTLQQTIWAGTSICTANGLWPPSQRYEICEECPTLTSNSATKINSIP
jgi:hypothetical protein